MERHARYDVDRCLLYVFRTGVAILVVDLSLTSQLLTGDTRPTGLNGRLVNETLTLADAQTLLDLVRRAYTPFFREGNELPHLVVTHARWVRGKGSESTLHEVAKAAEAVAILIKGERERAPPVFDHWREILPEAWHIGAAHGEGRTWRHVVDERMPMLAVVSVGEPGEVDNLKCFEAIRDSDLARLCFADHEGEGSPADPDFLAGFEAAHIYARFRHWGTLYLVSGYAFTQLLAGSKDGERYFAVHMRRHYYQLMLLAQFELASLLAFSSRVSRIIGAHHREVSENQGSEARLQRRMRSLQRDVLEFVHRFRFTGVTNQVQGQELTDLLRRHLRLDAIYSDLKDEIDSANDFLARAAGDREAAAAAQLSGVATFGLAASVATSLLGMNVIFDADTVKGVVRKLGGLGASDEISLPIIFSAQFVVLAAVVSAVFALSSLVVKASRERGGAPAQDARIKRIRRILSWISLGALGAAGTASVVLWRLIARLPPPPV
ncbi:hypothetical protein CHKEEEPN_2478 [Methylorubrum podarium]|nr:hypothetical protein CHKEEEPN_2478 [Methylorubrum podarium]